MKQLLVVLFGVFLMGTGSVSAEGNTKTLHMQIEGMTCGRCSAMLTKKLMPLCASVSVNHQTGKGQCTYAPDKTTPDAITKVVRDAGYTVVKME